MLAKFRTGMGLPDAPVQTELTGERFINELFAKNIDEDFLFKTKIKLFNRE